MPCRRKIEKTAALWWKSDLNRYRVDYEPISAPLFHHAPGLKETRMVLIFLVFLADLPTAGICSFLGLV
jgi:hypothetical protein